jgi:two-component system NtrC family response regulator
MAESKQLTAKDLELNIGQTEFKPVTLKDAREALEREMVQNALQRHNNKITAASAELGISRPTLYELMEKLGIIREKAKDSE